MTELHPDKLNNADTTNNTTNLDKNIDASDVTHAYEIVSHPLTRASHMLESYGMQITESDTGNDDFIGMDFLLEVMEIRQNIEDVVVNESKERMDEKLRPIWTENQQAIQTTIAHMEEAFEKNDLEEAKKLTAQLQYWFRVEETIVEKMSVIQK